MSSCGGNCSCGSSCSCGSCSCGRSFDIETDYCEMNTTNTTIILGVAPSKMFAEAAEMGMELSCKCGPNCSCDPCDC